MTEVWDFRTSFPSSAPRRIIHLSMFYLGPQDIKRYGLSRLFCQQKNMLATERFSGGEKHRMVNKVLPM
jgi:hypothetical protein